MTKPCTQVQDLVIHGRLRNRTKVGHLFENVTRQIENISTSHCDQSDKIVLKHNPFGVLCMLKSGIEKLTNR